MEKMENNLAAQVNLIQNCILKRYDRLNKNYAKVVYHNQKLEYKVID